jgi:hypothetical protein
MDWSKASGDTMVCEECNLTLRDVVKVIALQDASSVEDVLSLTGACSDASHEDCHKKIGEILDIYVPIYAALKGGCGGG